ncbi:MAG: hypothetical protein ABJA71_17495 [Ginsengibacter sp.]
MKKFLPALFFCAMACMITSCRHSNDTSLSFTESDQYYSMKAHFSKNKTRNVEEYMDRRIGRRNNISFANTQGDAIFTLDDHTTFYMKKSPGLVAIKMKILMRLTTE